MADRQKANPSSPPLVRGGNLSVPLDKGNRGGVVHERLDCRLCGSRNLTPIWSFGTTPLANAYLAPDAIGQPEVFAPLRVNFCQNCKLVQLRDVVDPTVLFDHYLYVSSTSPKFIAHFADYARAITERFNLGSTDLAVDIGSNDGILLKPFQGLGVRVLGIEPAQNIAALSTAAGIPTVAEFFTPDLATRLKTEHGPAQVITANNVFAHTDDVYSFTDSIKTLLAPDGVFIFEVQYLKDLVENNLFDIVYHEHLCYYHITPLIPFFNRHGLSIFDVEPVSVHGGSIRVFVQHADGPHTPTAQLTSMLHNETHLNELTPYTKCAQRIEKNRHTLQRLLASIKQQNKRIVGYGAPAKATTLCYAFGIDSRYLDYIVDDDAKLKQGLCMPGTHIPIKAPAELYRDHPDYVLILAWNFAEAIMQTHARFTSQGGKFIIPVPEPRIVE